MKNSRERDIWKQIDQNKKKKKEERIVITRYFITLKYSIEERSLFVFERTRCLILNLVNGMAPYHFSLNLSRAGI